MINKLIGAMMLATGGGLLCAREIKRRRKEIRLLYELAVALESMEGLIRWEKATLPLAIERQCRRMQCGSVFADILSLMKSDSTLQVAWGNAFSKVSAAEDILCRLEFSGDEECLTGQLHLAAQQLRQRAEQCNAGRAESEKLYVAVYGSVVGLLTILLL